MSLITFPSLIGVSHGVQSRCRLSAAYPCWRQWEDSLCRDAPSLVSAQLSSLCVEVIVPQLADHSLMVSVNGLFAGRCAEGIARPPMSTRSATCNSGCG